MNDEQFFLANAYLDGELTADERAVAESDPAVMAEVERLRDLQRLLRDVEPPSDRARETAIAAAMARFSAGAATTPPVDDAPAPIPFRPRPAYAKYLAVAAGVIGVGVLGVAVANLGVGGGDDADSSAVSDEAATEEPADDGSAFDTGTGREMAETMTADEPAAEEPAAEMSVADDSADMADEEMADAPSADQPADEPAEMPAEEPAEEPASDEPASEPAGDDGGDISIRPTLVPGQVLATPAELGSYGTTLVEERDAGVLPPTPNHACDVDDVLGTAEYLFGEVPRTVLVAVDEDFGIVLAIDPDSCADLVNGPLYLP